MGEAIGRVYVDRYCDPISKARMQEMVSNLKMAYRERIQNLTWIEPETKKEALMKLEALDVQVGYPEEWLNYSELEVNNDSYVMNVLRASKFKFHHGPHGLDRIGKPVDRNLWETNPQVTNAYADYNKIIITFPAGILSLPSSIRTRMSTVNYRSIGLVIGHKMTHRWIAREGSLIQLEVRPDRSTPEDADNFNMSKDRFGGRVQQVRGTLQLNINGDLTLTENQALGRSPAISLASL